MVVARLIHPQLASDVDFDPETQDKAMRRIVAILQATSTDHRPGDLAISRHITEALDTYRAAVVELTLEGTLNIDQGVELMGMVERIVRDMDPGHASQTLCAGST